MSLDKNLRRLRRMNGLSQNQLSDKTGIRVAHISKMENGGGDPKLSTIYKLMDALQCSEESLIGRDKNLNGILKQMIESIEALPNEHKRTIITLIHYYSEGVGEQLRLTKNQNWFKEFILGDAIDNPLEFEKM